MSDSFKESEETAKCCLCFPIKCGMTTLGVFSIIGTIMGALGLVGSFSFGVIAIAFAGVALAFSAYVSLLFVKYFQGDSKETRDGLITAMWVSLIGNVVAQVGSIIRAMDFIAAQEQSVQDVTPSPLVPGLIGAAIGALISYYFVTVAKRFSDMSA